MGNAPKDPVREVLVDKGGILLVLVWSLYRSRQLLLAASCAAQFSVAISRVEMTRVEINPRVEMQFAERFIVFSYRRSGFILIPSGGPHTPYFRA